ncbi:unnamed protein product [Chrysoparadoxa australica]
MEESSEEHRPLPSPLTRLTASLLTFQKSLNPCCTSWLMQPSRVRLLFGGAMRCRIPTAWRDVSELRQVPDHQEVFVSSSSSGESLVIEVLSMPDGLDDHSSAAFFFNDMVDSDGGTGNVEFVADMTGSIVPTLPKVPKSCLIGVEEVQKFKGETGIRDKVRLYMVNIRLHCVTTDLLITLHVPQTAGSPSPQSSVDAFLHESQHLEAQALRDLLESFEITDWAIFGDEGTNT